MIVPVLISVSYEGFRSYWPAIAEDVSQPAVEREISRLNAAFEKVVVSNSLKPDEVEEWGSTRVVRRARQTAWWPSSTS